LKRYPWVCESGGEIISLSCLPEEKVSWAQWGDKDQVTPLAQGQQLNRLISGSRFSVLDNVGHIPHIEAPDGFYDVLLKELKFVAAR
jgi:hypothetical protein